MCTNCSLIQTTANVASVFIASFALFIAYRQLKKLHASSEAANLIKLRELLQAYEDIDLNLRPNGKWTKKSPKITEVEAQKLDRYMGILEAGVKMVETGLLSKGSFESQFGYRLTNILPDTYAMTRLLEENDYWGDLIKYLESRNKR